MQARASLRVNQNPAPIGMIMKTDDVKERQSRSLTIAQSRNPTTVGTTVRARKPQELTGRRGTLTRKKMYGRVTTKGEVSEQIRAVLDIRTLDGL